MALDVTVDAALKAEGIAREVVNRIQNMRKESGLNVSDRIDVDVNSSEEVKLAIEANIDYICSETLTQKLSFSENTAGETVEFDDIKMVINIKRHV